MRLHTDENKMLDIVTTSTMTKSAHLKHLDASFFMLKLKFAIWARVVKEHFDLSNILKTYFIHRAD